MHYNEFMEQKADIAVIGLAVMGQNLILNMNDHGFKVVAYNRTVSKVQDFLDGAAKDTQIIGANSIEDMINKLAHPRKVMLMVKAGEAVDQTISQITPLLEPGDVIIDGGNSLFTDTIRRVEEAEAQGFLYVGTGVSGGEEGARNGPAIMPGGSPNAWPLVKDIFQTIAAKTPEGDPCCDWVGEGGAGHYVKMVHNGIEYGDMQLIAESYDLLKNICNLSNAEISKIFAEWNNGVLDSYLIQITSEILAYEDVDGTSLVDNILDSAGQKGTGKWTVISSADLGQPVTLISEALYARFISSQKQLRLDASQIYPKTEVNKVDNAEQFISDLEQALYASKIISYTQGYMLMSAAAEEHNWNLNYAGIAKMWSGGCIIRSKFLADISRAYENNTELKSLLFDEFFSSAILNAESSWRSLLSEGIQAGIPLPAISSALSFYDSFRSSVLPANLIQAQRDYFGAHTYERLDKPAGGYFHTDWTGHGGGTASSTYDA